MFQNRLTERKHRSIGQIINDKIRLPARGGYTYLLPEGVFLPEADVFYIKIHIPPQKNYFSSRDMVRMLQRIWGTQMVRMSQKIRGTQMLHMNRGQFNREDH